MKNVEDIYELSPLQHGMLFHTLYAPRSGAYIEQFSWTLDRGLNLANFKRAWQQVIDRHTVLRTGFNWKDLDKPLQIVYREVKFPWDAYDWRKFSSAEQQERLKKFLEADRKRGFDLTKVPLIRLAVFRTDEAYQFVLSHHHILMDGWCGPLIMGEVLAFYNAFCRGETLNLPLPRPYRDYITWLQKQNAAKAKSFWQETLQGFKAPTTPGIDQSPGGLFHQDGTYASRIVEVPATTTQAIQNFARAHGLTFNTLVQGAWGLLMSHYSGQEDVVFGTVVSGRPAELTGIEAMTGLFVNTLPMRMKVSPQAGLLSWLKQIQVHQAEMRQYEYTPLVNIQGWSEIPRGTPLFENLLIFENYPSFDTSASTKDELTIREFRAFEQTNYPLTMMVVPGTFLKVIYDCNRFDASAIADLLQHFQNLLDRIVQDANPRLADVAMLSQGEVRHILTAWNATAADFPKEQCVHQCFEAQARQTPEDVAVIFKGQSLTYNQLNQRADRLAHCLQVQGIGPDVLVGICVERSLEMMVGLLGILKAGGAYVPLDPAYPKERLAYILEDSRSGVLLTQKALLESLPAYLGKIICLDEDLWVDGNPVLHRQVGAENLAYVIYTSGSTGRPKGVQIPHRAVVNLLESMRRQPGFTQKDVLLAVTTLCFDIAGLELFLPLMVGGKLVIAGREESVDEVRLPALLQENRVTVMQATPVTWRLLLDSAWKGSPALTILCGGEAFPLDLAGRLIQCGKELWNMYGPTETTIWSSLYRVNGQEERIVPIGRPVANTQMYVLDRQLKPVPLGVLGDLYIGGAGLARGYWNAPEATAEKFVPHPFVDVAGARMYATGDMARYLPDGNVEFLGRMDHQVKVRGLRIELGEIETVLAQHPGVCQGVVSVRADKNGQGQLVAYIVPDWNYRDPESERRQDIEQAAAWQTVWNDAYHQPSVVEDATFNISGWKSSYTGQPIPAEEMREWVDQAVERILALQPKRVLEIGCGTGLLLFRVAPRCIQYTGTDFSEQAVQSLQLELSKDRFSQVELSNRMADDFDGIQAGDYDTVILNSVIQYFPSADYLMRVLDGAVKTVAGGGTVYIGDVRSLPLLEAFHTSIQLERALPTTSGSELLQQIQTGVSQEKELVVDPAFFVALKQHLPGVCHVEILPKRGKAQNEMTKFRYDVILHVAKEIRHHDKLPWLDWESNMSLAGLRLALSQETPAAIGFKNVPNARVLPELQVAEWLADGKREGTVNEIRQALQASQPEGVQVDDLCRLGDELHYQVQFNWASGGKSYDVVFQRKQIGENGTYAIFPSFPGPPQAGRAWQEYVRAPAQNLPVRQLLIQLHDFAEAKLPEYMVPSLFMVLEKMPLTPNGKIDRRALPAPGGERPDLAGDFVAPRTETEGTLARIWQRLLGVEQVGRDDNFFRLGGHSLNAIQLVNRIRDNFNVEIPLRMSYETSTVAELAEQIDKERIEIQNPSTRQGE